MKKGLLIVLGIIALLGIGGYSAYKMAYGGTTYYMQVKTDGQKEIAKADDGTDVTRYRYRVNAYDKQGEAKKIDFYADHNLRQAAYLSLTYNNKKGVTSWEKVTEKSVPLKARQAINKQ